MRNVFIGLIALVAFTAASSFAQPNNTQDISLIVPTVLRVDVSPATLILDLSSVVPTPGTDLIGSVTNSASTYRYVHNVAGGATVSIGLDAPLTGTGLELEAQLAAPPAGGSSTLVDLTGGAAADAVSGIPRGAGSATVTYTFRAYASSADPGTEVRTVTFTMHN